MESPGENENLNEAPQGAMRLLVLLNHNSPLKTAITFLTRRGYEITIVHDVNEFLKILFELKPHMTLISWNQKNANVRNIHEMITNKFKIDCVILAENATTNSAAALMSSGLPHFVLPPVSGPSIHMRIQSIIRKRKSATENEHRKSIADQKKHLLKEKNRQSSEENRREIKTADLPDDVEWAASHDDPQNWKGFSEKSKKTYFFKGPEAPKFFSATQQWNFQGTHAPIIFEDSDDYHLDTLNEPAIDWELARKDAEKEMPSLRESEVELPLNIESISKYEAQTNGLPSKLDPEGVLKIFLKNTNLIEATTATLEKNYGELNKDAKCTAPSGEIYALKIKGNSVPSGYLLFRPLNNQVITRELLLAINNELTIKMQEFRKPIDVYALSLQFVWPNFEALKFDFSKIAFYLETAAVSVCFIEIPSLPTPHKVIGDYCRLNIDTDLFRESELTFDIFLHLPKNEKFIHYLAAGQTLKSHVFKKLIDAGATDIYIKVVELEMYENYFARYSTFFKSRF